MPSFILVHPTVWPQYTNVRDRQTEQTDRQRSDRIGRAVLQTVARKRWQKFNVSMVGISVLVWTRPTTKLIMFIHRNDKTRAQQLLRWATVWPQQTWAEKCGGLLWGLGPHLTQCGLGRGLPLYQVASWSIQTFGHNCRNANHVPSRRNTLTDYFIPSLVVETFTVRVHWVTARYKLKLSK